MTQGNIMDTVAMVVPKCPKCGMTMAKREGPYGKFWGCSVRKCRGTRNMVTPRPLVDPPDFGSQQQKDIWHWFANGTQDGQIAAVAGAGKSFTIAHGWGQFPYYSSILNLAFNKHIELSLTAQASKMGLPNVSTKTYNGLGNGIVKKAYPDASLWPEKLYWAVGEILGKNAPYPWLEAVEKLSRLCKAYVVDGLDDQILTMIATRHQVDIGMGSEDIIITERLLAAVPKVLELCKNTVEQGYDYDDQCWLPIVLSLPLPAFDVVIIDEAQDTSRVQLLLAYGVSPRGRVISVGDPHQAIYGFRGADAKSMESLQTTAVNRSQILNRPGPVVLPLTFTRRCPRSHANLVQSIVPHIEALPDAPEGRILTLSESAARKQVLPGHLVICRTNAPLVDFCLRLYKIGKKAFIRGRDVGKGIKSMIERHKAPTIAGFLENVDEWEKSEIAKLSYMRHKSRIESIKDRAETIRILCEDVKDYVELSALVDRIFADWDDEENGPKDAILLGSIHRTKGLESTHVYILRPDLIPHAAAQQEWEVEQERNLAYIAGTRAKFDKESGEPGTLIFIGTVPTIYTQITNQ